ncbi:MAG: hypothetical protein QM662_06115, partial [Gordonia sp. (in: high G+C Gram-positive bacteria)]
MPAASPALPHRHPQRPDRPRLRRLGVGLGSITLIAGLAFGAAGTARSAPSLAVPTATPPATSPTTSTAPTTTTTPGTTTPGAMQLTPVAPNSQLEAAIRALQTSGADATALSAAQAIMDSSALVSPDLIARLLGHLGATPAPAAETTTTQPEATETTTTETITTPTETTAPATTTAPTTTETTTAPTTTETTTTETTTTGSTTARPTISQ